jgi:hypothetical protein
LRRPFNPHSDKVSVVVATGAKSIGDVIDALRRKKCGVVV